MIGVNPAVKMKSASAAPEIATASPSGGQVPMTDDVPTDSETVSVDVSMLPAGSPACSDEDDKDEHEDSGHVDDDDEGDEINHEALPKEAVRAHTPSRRERRSTLWKYLRRIDRYDLPGHGMKEDCTHVCVYPLSEGETGVKRATRCCSTC